MIIRYTSTMIICIWLLLLLSNVATATITNSDKDQIKIHVLIYETAIEEDNAVTVTASQRKRQLRSQSKSNKATSPAQKLVNQMNDLNQLDLLEASIFGQGHEFIGFGSKLIQVLPVLKQMQQRHQQLHLEDSDTLVIISDSRDVLFNSHSNHLGDQMTVASRRSYVKQLVNEFHTSYDSITSGSPSIQKVVISAEAQCCVSALTHVSPGNAYYNKNTMDRNQYSCSSGTKECLWNGDEYAQPWENIMKDLQLKRTNGIEYDDVYLNAGLMVGTVSDLIHIITKLQIQDLEDDQALLTDYMYYNPNTILLDYSQTLFGNNRGGLELNGIIDDGCVFHKEAAAEVDNDGRLVHLQTGTKPLLLHTPGKYYACYDRMASDLGHVTSNNTKEIRTRLLQISLKARLCNYGVRTPVLGDGIVGNAVTSGCEQYTPSAITPSSPTSVVPVSAPVTAPVTAPSILDNILGGRTPISVPVPVPTPTFFDVVPVPTPTFFDVVPVPTSSLGGILGGRVPVPTPTFSDLIVTSPTTPTVTAPTTTEEVPTNFLDLLDGAHSSPSVATAPADVPTVPVAFLDLLDGAHSSPVAVPVATVPVSFLDLLTVPTTPATTTDIAAPANVPTPTSVEGVPTTFLDLLMTPTVPTTVAATPISVSAPTNGVPVAFLDFLGGSPSATIPTPAIVVIAEPTPTTPITTTEQVPVSFFDLLNVPTDGVVPTTPTNDIIIVSTPTTPIEEPISTEEESSSFMDALMGRSSSTETVKEPVDTIVILSPASAPVSIPTSVESTEVEDPPGYFDFLQGDFRE